MATRLLPFAGYTEGENAQKQNRRDYYRNNPSAFGQTPAVYDMLLREYVDPKTGNRYSGPIIGNGGAVVGHSVNGQWSATPAQTNTGNNNAGSPSFAAGGVPPDFPKLVTTVQQPEVYNQAKAGLNALPGQAAKTGTAFDQLLAQQSEDLSKLRSTAPQAYDASGTEAELRGANQRFETGSNDVLSQMEQRNRDYEASQKANQEAKQAELGRYETAAQNVANRAVSNAERFQKGVMASANPDQSQGWSGAQSNRFARIYSDINTPLQRELSGLRTGLLTEGGNLNREYLANDNATLQFNQALNNAFRGNTVQISQYLQNLRTALRQASAQEAAQLIAREADTLGLGQRLRSGEISIAQMLQALERSAVDFTYQQPFDPSRVAATASFSPSWPTSRYTPQPNPVSVGGGPQPSSGAGITDRERWAAYARSPQYDRNLRPVSPPSTMPNYGNPSANGWGYVNGEYIGNDANAWNDAVYGPVT